MFTSSPLIHYACLPSKCTRQRLLAAWRRAAQCAARHKTIINGQMIKQAHVLKNPHLSLVHLLLSKHQWVRTCRGPRWVKKQRQHVVGGMQGRHGGGAKGRTVFICREEKKKKRTKYSIKLGILTTMMKSINAFFSRSDKTMMGKWRHVLTLCSECAPTSRVERWRVSRRKVVDVHHHHPIQWRTPVTSVVKKLQCDYKHYPHTLYCGSLCL